MFLYLLNDFVIQRERIEQIGVDDVGIADLHEFLAQTCRRGQGPAIKKRPNDSPIAIQFDGEPVLPDRKHAVAVL